MSAGTAICWHTAYVTMLWLRRDASCEDPTPNVMTCERQPWGPSNVSHDALRMKCSRAADSGQDAPEEDLTWKPLMRENCSKVKTMLPPRNVEYITLGCMPGGVRCSGALPEGHLYNTCIRAAANWVLCSHEADRASQTKHVLRMCCCHVTAPCGNSDQSR